MSTTGEKSPKPSVCVSYKARIGKALGANIRERNIHSYASKTRAPAIQQTFQVWPEREKRALLEAMKKYGHSDYDSLCKALPGKSKDNIRMAIAMWWKSARIAMLSSSKGTKNPEKLTKPKKIVKKASKDMDKAPIDQWLQKLEQKQPLGGFLETKLVAKVFLYISKFEKHPSPMECNGIDYKALYGYLYCMLNGHPGKDLNQATSEYLMDSLNEIAGKIRERGRSKETDFLSWNPRTGPIRQYSGKKKLQEPETQQAPDPSSPISIMKQLLEVPGFNPLEVPLDMLKK